MNSGKLTYSYPNNSGLEKREDKLSVKQEILTYTNTPDEAAMLNV